MYFLKTIFKWHIRIAILLSIDVRFWRQILTCKVIPALKESHILMAADR